METTIADRTAVNWSPPFHGMSHSEGPIGKAYATLIERDVLVDLLRWIPGRGFSPLLSQHETVDAAKSTAEAWLKEAA